jgi:hypothetical protein
MIYEWDKIDKLLKVYEDDLIEHGEWKPREDRVGWDIQI